MVPGFNSRLAGFAGLLGLTCLVALLPAGAPAQSALSLCAESGGLDEDADGLSNTCEFELAMRFAPVLMVNPRGCNWDESNGRLGGGYFFGVQRVDSVLRIAYLPAYFHDCGWSGPKCWVPFVDCSPHAGDSEFIVIELAGATGDEPAVTGIFLSAHCFGSSGSDCRWYRGNELSGFTWRGASPVVWVGAGRNANYATRRACDRGHHSLDTCDRNTAEFTYPIISERNIGSKARPSHQGGCVPGRELDSAVVDPDAIECFWQPDSRFRGWNSAVEGVTGYYRYLIEIAGF